jgi:Flp pilus assembly protein TadG
MGAARRRLLLRLRMFPAGNKGVTFVEFAIIAIPLFLLFFSIIEVGLIFWATYDLENATATAARLVRTGQAQSMNTNNFLTQLCSQTVILSNCTSQVQVNIQTFASFSTMTAPNPIGSNGNLLTTFNGNPQQVGPSQDVLVTTYYEWPLINPLISAVLGNLSDGNCLIQSAVAFRSEPF